MFTASAETYDELQRLVLAKLAGDPDHISRPRGMSVKEVLGAHLELRDPRARLSLSPTRAANYSFAAGEFLWYLRGAEDLKSITYYNPRMAEFSDDGETLNSAYGQRMFGGGQWGRVVAELKRDPDSRRAVMTIFTLADLIKAVGPGTKDVPCTLSLQFFIRDGLLHLHVTMRSNDAVWGLCNDLFSFTLLQETMMLDLRDAGMKALGLGSYTHSAGSLHLYERHFELAKIVASEAPRGAEGARMPPIDRRSDLDALLVDEAALREGALVGAAGYSGGAAWLFDKLLRLRLRKNEALAWPRVGLPAAA